MQRLYFRTHTPKLETLNPKPKKPVIEEGAPSIPIGFKVEGFELYRP